MKGLLGALRIFLKFLGINNTKNKVLKIKKKSADTDVKEPQTFFRVVLAIIIFLIFQVALFSSYTE